LTGKSNAPSGRREAILQTKFLEDLRFWIETDRKTALRLLQIVEAVLRDPFQGLGKPEPLKHFLTGAWSRRLTQEHRVVYLVEEGKVRFLQARFHY
jgi:toxin YoeB